MRNVLFLSAAIALIAGCGVPLAKKCSADSDCPSDAVCDTGACRAVLSLTFRSPGGATAVRTNGAIDLQLEVAGASPAKLELFCDGAPLAELKSPYQYRWDTRGLEEGSHTVTARAAIGTLDYASAPLVVVVDRTPPLVIGQSPAAGETRVPRQAPIAAEFSEPVELPPGSPDSVVELIADGALRLDHRCSLSNGGTQLEIALSSEPEPPTQVTLTWMDGVTDLAGNPLRLPPPASWKIPSRCNTDAECVSPELCQQGMCLPASSGDCRSVTCSVAIEAPGTTVYTNGLVPFRIGLEGAPPDRVELLKDGTPLGLLAPPYRYSWDTRGEPEGSYQLVARATQGAVVYTSQPRTVVVDRTPPRVVDQLPANGDRNVGLHAPMAVRFSEPVQLPAAPVESVELTGAGGVTLSARVELLEERRLLQIYYVFEPAVPADLALRLRAGIADLAGNPLVLPGQTSWHLPRWQRLGPAVSQLQQLQGVDMAVDAAGRPAVAWGLPEGIGVARWSGSGWQELGRGIRGPGSTGYYLPRIALRPSGEPVLAWTEDLDPRSDRFLERIIVKHWTAGEWQELGQNSIGPSNTSSSQPSLAIGSDGQIWLGSQERGMAGGHAVVRRYHDTFGWVQQGGTLDRLGRESNGPQLAFDRDGALWAAWTESTGLGGIDNRLVFDLFASRFDSGGWIAVGGVLNQEANAPAHLGALVPVPGGLPIVTWAERMSGGSFKGWYRRSSSLAWGPAEAAVGAGFYSVSALGATGTGDLYAVGVDTCLVHRKAQGQATWTTGAGDRICENPSSLAANGAIVRTTASGEVLLLWPELESDRTTISLYVKRLNR